MPSPQFRKTKNPANAGFFTYIVAASGCFAVPRRLLGIHAHLIARAILVLELHHAVDQRVDGEVGTEAHVATGMPLRAALPDDDVAGNDFLAAKLLHATVLRIAVASVSRRADALFMCHKKLLSR